MSCLEHHPPKAKFIESKATRTRTPEIHTTRIHIKYILANPTRGRLFHRLSCFDRKIEIKTHALLNIPRLVLSAYVIVKCEVVKYSILCTYLYSQSPHTCPSLATHLLQTFSPETQRLSKFIT